MSSPPADISHAGERDEDALAAGLDEIDRAILHQILAGIADAAGGRAVDG